MLPSPEVPKAIGGTISPVRPISRFVPIRSLPLALGRH